MKESQESYHIDEKVKTYKIMIKIVLLWQHSQFQAYQK